MEAWIELASEVVHVDDSVRQGIVCHFFLQAWLEDVSAYVKSLDANHLVSGGGGGSFGASTPQYFNVSPTFIPLKSVSDCNWHPAPSALTVFTLRDSTFSC